MSMRLPNSLQYTKNILIIVNKSCLLNSWQFLREFLRTSTGARNLIGQSIVAIPTFGGNDLHLQGKQP